MSRFSGFSAAPFEIGDHFTFESVPGAPLDLPHADPASVGAIVKIVELHFDGTVVVVLGRGTLGMDSDMRYRFSEERHSLPFTEVLALIKAEVWNFLRHDH